MSKKILENLEAAGQNVRKFYQRRLPSDSSKDYYYILRDTPNTEALIVEYGFLDSKGDDINLLKNNYSTLAEAVVKSIAEYLGVPYNNLDGYYTVKSGDTLWSISKKVGISVDKLKSINNLNSNMLSVGQQLKIKDNIDDNSYYIVKKGDTLYSIANLYNMSVSDLKSLNNLTSDSLGVGQKLYVSSAEFPSVDDSDYNYYIVKKGDTLYSIARDNNMSVNDLKIINNLTGDILSVGQKLLINNNKVYTVESGDSLYSISRRFNTTVSELQELNNLVSTVLSVGQKLLLP